MPRDVGDLLQVKDFTGTVYAFNPYSNAFVMMKRIMRTGLIEKKKNANQ